jgi:tripartite ATP-independent transporter DctM subunit
MALFILALFFVLGLIGMPIGFVLGVTTVLGFLMMGEPMYMSMLSQKFFSAMNEYTFLALPLFLLAGDIMNKIGLTEKIVSFSNLFFGRLRGGLAQVNIVTSIIFGGISGSAVSDTFALGSVFIPSMSKQGYGRDFSSAITAASSVIAPIIPPSIVMVIYGGIMGVSIAGLFAAAIVPGLLIGIALMVMTRIIAGRRKYPQFKIPFTFASAFSETKKAGTALLLPVIILGGILGGICTPTEAAAIAVAYALFLGLVLYRNLTVKELYGIFYQCAVYMGIIILILSSASVLGWLLTIEQIPEKVAELFLSISSNKYVILLLINLFLILVGMFMDIIASMIILAPILAPLATDLGVDPLHFGIMMCVNLLIALITPPMGGCLFATMIVGKVDFGPLLKEIWPFIFAEIFVLFLIIFVPEVTMFVPRLLGLV